MGTIAMYVFVKIKFSLELHEFICQTNIATFYVKQLRPINYVPHQIRKETKVY